MDIDAGELVYAPAVEVSEIGDLSGGLFGNVVEAAGVAAVYTPKDFDLTAIMGEIVEIAERGAREAA